MFDKMKEIFYNGDKILERCKNDVKDVKIL